jgi:hypothetical protein
MPDNSRACTKCGLDKPLPEFSKNPRGKYGVKSSCKACDSARHAAQHVPKQRTLRPPRDQSEPKTCTKCGITKQLADFSLARKATATSNAVYRSECKPCCSARAKQWFRDNPGRTSANRRKFNLANNYGLTVDEYNAMLRRQGGVCAICGKSEPAEHGRTGKQFRLAVDHCHETGAVRGLLCQKCNRAVGLLGDDPILLRKAISYLLRTREGAENQGGQ